jgi:hypothetical protein
LTFSDLNYTFIILLTTEKYPMYFIKKVIIIIVLLTLFGCKEAISLSDACLKFPEMCSKIKPEGMCKAKRNDAVISRFMLGSNKSSRQRFQLLIALEDYIKCAKELTFIEYIDPVKRSAEVNKLQGKTNSEKDNVKLEKYALSLRKRASDKLLSYNYASDLLSLMVEEFNNPTDYYMMYWYWSRNKDSNSIGKLVAADKKRLLKNHDLIYYVAQQYIKYDTDLALDALYRSLKSYPVSEYIPKATSTFKTIDPFNDNNKLHFSIFRSLSKIYFKRKDYNRSYVYAYLLTLNNDTTANTVLIKKHILPNNVNLKVLDNLAKNIHEDIQRGAFKSH